MTIWAVLAGGKGSRYGVPKALASHGQSTFLGHCLGVIEHAREPHDTVAVSVAFDWQPDVPLHCAVVTDTEKDPGPAHSIGRLARFAAEKNDLLVFMAVDMLGVTALGLQKMRDIAAESTALERPHIAVASAGGRLHWVFGAIPAPLVGLVASNAESVNAVQVLLRLCPIREVEVAPDELLDVNTPDLKPASPPMS